MSIFVLHSYEVVTDHSLQKRKVICSIFFFGSSPELDAGEAMMSVTFVAG